MLFIFLNIIRWKELLYLTFILFLFKFSFLYGYGFKTTLTFFDLGILSISGSLILASGYLINYYYKKQRGEKKISKKKIKTYYTLFGFFGILFGTFLSFKIQKPTYSFIIIFCYLIIFIYSKNITKKAFINNLVKSVLKGLTILLVCWFDSPTIASSTQWDLFFKLQVIIIIYVIISFLRNIVREIIISINNLNHDNASKYKTLPILLGRNRAKNIALGIGILDCLIILSVTIIYAKNIYLFAIIMLLGTIPELFFIYHLMNASKADDYKFLYKTSNVCYFLAVLSIPLIAYYFKYVIN